MSYARTQAGAKKRVKIKRELRILRCKGWKNDDPLYKLKNKLSRCKKVRG